MKHKIFAMMVLVVFAVAAFAAPVVIDAAAQGVDADAGAVAVVSVQADGGDIVDPVQLYWIGLVASAIVYIVKTIMTKYPDIKIKREWLTVALYVAAFVLAVSWGGVAFPTFPVFDDPLTFVSAFFVFCNDLLVALAVPTSFATLIYNVLLKRVFDGIAVKAGLDRSEIKRGGETPPLR